MKLKYLFLPLLALCMTAASSNAAVTFSVSDTVPKPGGVGTGTRVTTTTSGTVGTLTSTLPNFTYTINGLNLTSLGGGVSDSVTFQIAYTQTGGTGVTGTTWGNIGVTGTSSLISGAEILTLTPTITAETSTLILSNFSILINRVQLGDYGSSDQTSVVHAGGTILKNFATDTNKVVDFANSSFARIDHNGTGDGTSMEGFRVEITIVPEPGAALLGSLGMLALLRRRRLRNGEC